MTHLMNNYGQPKLTLEAGHGIWVKDTDGKVYLDALGGIAVCILGHSHPAVTEAIQIQAATLTHCSNLYAIPQQQQLADKLCEISGQDKVFFCNSGTEANEAAIKLARLHGHQQGFSQPKIIVMDGAFHGRTLASLSATGNPKAKEGFAPLVEGFVRVPYNDADAVKKAFAEHSEVVAVLVEPVQGEGGVNVPSEDYLVTLRAICDQHNALLMLDEIQTGMGRTGAWFAFQFEDLQPDVLTLAKALGNGVPIGACLARGNAAELFQPGSHGSTFGGNPLACAAALAVIETIEEQEYVDRALELGEYMLAGFNQALNDTAGIKEIRGHGLMLGIQLDKACGELVNIAAEAGLLINVAAGDTVRLLPAMILSDDEADQIVDMVSALIKHFLSEE